MFGARFGSRRRPALWSIGALLGAGAATLLFASHAPPARGARNDHRPIEVHGQRYVSSSECRSCHPSEYASWSSTYHRRMTQLAAPDTVLGRFDGVMLGDLTLGQSELGYYVDVGAPTRVPPERHSIPLLTGSHHMQIYWYESGHDRNLVQLPYVYLNADRRWVPRSAVFIEPPQAVHGLGEGRWNRSCITCHTTLGQPRADANGGFDTHVAEFGIACEACHGPGEEHVDRNHSPLARYLRHLAGSGDDSIVQPKKLTHERASYVCAQCHSTWLFDGPASARAWSEHGTDYRPGSDGLGSAWLVQPSRAAVDPRIAGYVRYDPTTIASEFWSDGVMRVSGREFNGMVDSPCYVRGELSCSSCHAMHQHAGDARPTEAWRVNQLAAGMDGDRGCLQCHDEYARAPEQHTHHAAGSEGSRCYNCHMPYTSYGLLKALRNHRIDVPTVQATSQAGRPNACNLCHLDKSLAWTAEQLRVRFGVSSPPVVDGELASQSVALVLGLRGDAGQRALIAWAFGWAPARATAHAEFAPGLLGALMDDPYTAVRYVAAHSLAELGVSSEELGYDFVDSPSSRPPIAERVVQRLAPELAPAARAAQRAAFEPLLRQRDDRPLQLLE